MVLYRKYRPQNIAQLDSTEVRDHIMRVLTSSFIPHALLFCGPRGTGKTSAARIVAKVLNCEHPVKTKSDKEKTIEPCNECDSCRTITEGSHLDVFEIDAASNRGIEEIRDLREKIRLAPTQGKYKIYIIDEVHMLTNEAFNALLKTLEEPPAHAVFILATTDPDKLPSTIHSRCLAIRFKRAGTGEILHSLKRVVKGEKLTVGEDVLFEVAQLSDGSFRDATKLLEQAVSENALDIGKIQKLFGKHGKSPRAFIELLVLKKPTELLEFIKEMEENGSDVRLFVSELLEEFHDLLLASYGISAEEKDKKKITLTPMEINKLIKLFSTVYVSLRGISNPILPLEVAVIDWTEGR